jgi:hypothetical protein
VDAMTKVVDWWNLYVDRVYDDVLPPLQYQEVRRGFYAGFHAALVAGLAMVDEYGEDEDAAVVELEKLRQECRAFSDAVEKGQA